MPITEQSIVPFGKYKGKQYSEMIKDKSYCKYLLKGTWLKGATREFLEDVTRCKMCDNRIDNPLSWNCPGCGGKIKDLEKTGI
jgi:rubredoxin